MSSGCLNARNTPVSTTDSTPSMMVQLARICSAPFWLFSPMRMAIRGAPPSPTRKAKEEISVTTGPQTPAPASATPPISGMLPIKIRSTML